MVTSDKSWSYVTVTLLADHNHVMVKLCISWAGNSELVSLGSLGSA